MKVINADQKIHESKASGETNSIIQNEKKSKIPIKVGML